MLKGIISPSVSCGENFSSWRVDKTNFCCIARACLLCLFFFLSWRKGLIKVMTYTTSRFPAAPRDKAVHDGWEKSLKEWRKILLQKKTKKTKPCCIDRSVSIKWSIFHSGSGMVHLENEERTPDIHQSGSNTNPFQLNKLHSVFSFFHREWSEGLYSEPLRNISSCSMMTCFSAWRFFFFKVQFALES